MPNTESLLLATVRVSTFRREKALTRASGFFFECSGLLFLVTSRHVVIDEPAGHFPDRIEIGVHGNPHVIADLTECSVPLYRDGRSVWHQGTDSNGDIDVVAVELNRSELPASMVYRAFTPQNLPTCRDQVEVGGSLLIVGFPQEPHDDIRPQPVVRQAVIASSFGLHSGSSGYFLMDASVRDGTSGAPVVARAADPASTPAPLAHWMLLGVHSSRRDLTKPGAIQDVTVGLTCVWYADVLMPASADSA